jgi:hypothetical protein
MLQEYLFIIRHTHNPRLKRIQICMKIVGIENQDLPITCIMLPANNTSAVEPWVAEM